MSPLSTRPDTVEGEAFQDQPLMVTLGMLEGRVAFVPGAILVAQCLVAPPGGPQVRDKGRRRALPGQLVRQSWS